jgi:hypothetical protein
VRTFILGVNYTEILHTNTVSSVPYLGKLQTIAFVLVIEMDRIRIDQALVIEDFVLSKYSPNKTIIK